MDPKWYLKAYLILLSIGLSNNDFSLLKYHIEQAVATTNSPISEIKTSHQKVMKMLKVTRYASISLNSIFYACPPGIELFSTDVIYPRPNVQRITAISNPSKSTPTIPIAKGNRCNVFICI